MMIQRRNLHESVRPELVLTEWSRKQPSEGSTSEDIIAFRNITNVGRGVALRVLMYTPSQDFGTYSIVNTSPLHILAPDQTAEVNYSIYLRWNTTQVRPAHNLIPITLKVLCWDYRNVRYVTTYKLLVSAEEALVAGMAEIAPRVWLGDRTTVRRPTWLLRLRSRGGRIPYLGRLFRETL